MKRKGTMQVRRRPYIDWLRVLAVLGVFYAHSIDMLDLINWRIKYQELSVGMMIFGNFVSQWGMSLMFLLAGESAWFALGSRNRTQFISERIKRLLIPFLVGTILLSPVEAYFEALRRSLYQGPFLQFVPLFFVSVRIGWNLRWLAAFGYHLWFLALLFLVSVLTLPLLVFLKRQPGQRFIRWLASICDIHGTLLLLAIPFVLVQIALQAPFPGYQNWANCVSWLISFLYGYILASCARFEQAIKSRGGVTLVAGGVGLMIMVVLYITSPITRWETGPVYSVGYIFYQTVYGLTTWSLLALVLYLAIHILDFSNRLLPYVNEAALPFYILHYPILAVMTYVLSYVSDNMTIRFLLISTLSLALTLFLYELFVRRIPIMRWLFGMKPPMHRDDIRVPNMRQIS